MAQCTMFEVRSRMWNGIKKIIIMKKYNKAALNRNELNREKKIGEAADCWSWLCRRRHRLFLLLLLLLVQFYVRLCSAWKSKCSHIFFLLYLLTKHMWKNLMPVCNIGFCASLFSPFGRRKALWAFSHVKCVPTEPTLWPVIGTYLYIFSNSGVCIAASKLSSQRFFFC